MMYLSHLMSLRVQRPQVTQGEPEIERQAAKAVHHGLTMSCGGPLHHHTRQARTCTPAHHVDCTLQLELFVQ